MKWRICVLLWVALLPAGNVTGQASFNVTPTKIYFQVPEGGVGEQTITVHNNGKETRSYAINFQAWERDAGGEKVFTSDTGQVFSIARYLQAEPSAFNLEAGDQQVVSVTLSQESPQPVQPSRWAMLLVKELNTNRVSEEGGGVRAAINVEYQIGVHVYQRMPGSLSPTSGMVLDSMYYIGVRERDRILIDFQNTGDLIVEGQLRIQVFGMDSGEQHELPLRSLTFLPNRERTVSVMLPSGLDPGDYTLTVGFDMGYESDLLVGDMYFQVPEVAD